MQTDLFQSCGHGWVFQICWYIECSTFTASSFRIWNSSTGIPSPPLALFIVMLSKAHLTSHSRMSGFRWVITPSWLSGSWFPHTVITTLLTTFLMLYITSLWLFILIGGKLHYFDYFATYQHESATDIQLWTPLPPLSTLSFWVVPEHQLWVPCFMHQTYTGHLFYIW